MLFWTCAIGLDRKCWGMGAKRELDEREITGLKHLRRLLPLFDRLHEVGCERDKAGNRQLHMDQYCALVLLFLFNPVLTSLRSIQQASELKKVQKQLGCRRASLGSLSEATRVFDPELLRGIIGELAAQVQPIRQIGQGHVDQLLIAVDGSVVKTLATIAKATYSHTKGGKPQAGWRLHTHFDLDRQVPKRIDVTPGKNGGSSDEKAVLRASLQSDHCYVMDRWYAQFALLNEIHAADSSYVCRVRDNSSYQVTESRPLTGEAVAADVLSDELVSLGGHGAQAKRPDHAVRLVQVRITPHQQRGRHSGSTGPGSDGILRIATNLLDPPAEIIAEIYRQRWTIEVFFRFFKHVLGCRHLLAQDQEGIEIQTYCAIIACLLISLWTGRKPTMRTYEMICHYFTGLADEEELLSHLAKLQPQTC
jgi:hypothetical protein